MHNWRNILLKPNDTLEKAIQILDQEALRIVLVTDDEGRLIGTVTDGDVRRALIKNLGMKTLIIDVMCDNPAVASIEDGHEEILAIMENKGLLQIPVLDQERRIVSLKTIQNMLKKEKYDNPVFLLAGGFGKRLHPLTDDIPKPLLTVGTKPILERILQQFIEAGFQNFYISTHYKAEMFREYFGDGSQWGINIEYVYESEPLGTAGALGLLPDSLPDLPMMMMNGDLLTKLNFDSLLKFHMENDSVATMCVREYDFEVPYGVIKAEDHRVTEIIEKPVHKFFVNAGIYVLSPGLVKKMKKNVYFDMPNFLMDQIKGNGQVNMFPLHEYWLDIGRIEEYEKAQVDVSGMFV